MLRRSTAHRVYVSLLRQRELLILLDERRTQGRISAFRGAFDTFGKESSLLKWQRAFQRIHRSSSQYHSRSKSFFVEISIVNDSYSWIHHHHSTVGLLARNQASCSTLTPSLPHTSSGISTLAPCMGSHNTRGTRHETHIGIKKNMSERLTTHETMSCITSKK